jgi:arylsulfatase
MSRFLQTFGEYPPSQRADSWSIDKITALYLNAAAEGAER